MSENLKATYGGIEIEYQERENKWRFELRGRERKADSLAAAKEVIDKPCTRQKKKFEAIAGWMKQGRWDDAVGKWKAVTVTSLADTPHWSSCQEVWISDNGKRSKEKAKDVFAATDENDARRAEYDRIQEEIDALQKKRDEVSAALKIIDLSGFSEQ
jgi:hypothetical protein